MNKLILVLILLFLINGCTNNQQNEVNLSEEIKDSEVNTTPKEVVQPVEEEMNIIEADKLFEEIMAAGIITKEPEEEPSIPHYRPAENNLILNKGYVSTKEGRDLFKWQEYSLYQIIDKEELLETSEDLKRFVEEEQKRLSEKFLYFSKNINYYETKKGNYWKPYTSYKINEVESEYGTIITNELTNFNFLGESIKEEYMIYSTYATCGKNIVFSLNPTNKPSWGGTLTMENAKSAFKNYINKERDPLIDKTKRIQEICKDVDFVLVENCTIDDMEKCKVSYKKQCANNDGLCNGLCTILEDDDCNLGDVKIIDAGFGPEVKKARQPVYLEYITLYNPSESAIGIVNMSLHFTIFKTELIRSEEFKDYTAGWIEDKKWIAQTDWFSYAYFNQGYPGGYLPSKGIINITKEDLRYSKSFLDDMPNSDVPLYEKGMVGKVGSRKGNITIRIYPNFWLNIEEANPNNNEYDYTFIAE